jgi:hypothetical protein
MLLGCSTKGNFNYCPAWPYGGAKVAEELENVPYDGYEDFWEWIARLYKLKQELDICKTPDGTLSYRGFVQDIMYVSLSPTR